MIRDIAFSVWFLLPAALANAAPIFAAALPGLRGWNTPLDGGRTFRGKPVLGSHKTWRGIVFGMVVATVVLGLQHWAINHFGWARHVAGQVDYRQLPPLPAGPLLALGALGGDGLESFVKRQRGTPSGESWLPFDQLDYIVGALLVSLLFVVLPLRFYVWMIVIWFAAHLLASYCGWLVGLKQKPL